MAKLALIKATTQLWIGNHQEVYQEIITLLKKIWCPADACNECITCQQITTHQHAHINWITPERTYTLELIEPLLHTLSFQADPAYPTFFILQKSELLTDICTNALLKSLEEPPTGYFFILCTSQKELLLDTLVSRTVITQFTAQKKDTVHPLYHFFTNANQLEPLDFLACLEKNKINEAESITLLNQLLEYWVEQQKIAPSLSVHHAIAMVHDSLKTPPMPGSSKLFWKNLFLLRQL